MTDAELLELVEHTPPEDLTVEQIELLRARLVESAELRAAVGAQLELEQYLNATLARPALSPEAIIGLAGSSTAGFSLAKLFGWGAATTLGLTIVAAVVVPPLVKDKTRVALKPVVEQPKTPEEVKKSVAKTDDKKPADEKLAVATGGKPAPVRAADSDDSPLDGFNGAAVPAQQVPPLERVMIEAEQFARGNVQVDTTRFGRNIGVITGPKGFHFVEYELNFPAAGKYSVEIRYAA